MNKLKDLGYFEVSLPNIQDLYISGIESPYKAQFINA
jgi:hypothetical protein